MVKCPDCNKDDWVKLVDGYTLCFECGYCEPPENEPKPPLRRLHHFLLEDLREMYPRQYMLNATRFLYSEIWQYKKEKKVFRITIMGETRGGKSETGFTLSMNNILMYNQFLKRGHYKKMKISKDVKFKPIKLTTDYVYSNESDYHYSLTDKAKNNKLVFGQLHFIDEDKELTGGIGSFSETNEMLNRNNIIAKFGQDEVYINPRKFLINNTPFGLNVFIKDEKNRMNWALLYKLQMTSEGLREQNFLGWVGIKLHPDEKFRTEYEAKKDNWIKSEIEGKVNERVERRKKAIEHMSNHPVFSQYKFNKLGAIVFTHNIDALKYLVEKEMSAKRIDIFNETEIERIVNGAKLEIEQKILGEQNGKNLES